MLLETERCLIRNFTAADIVPLSITATTNTGCVFRVSKGLRGKPMKPLC